MDCVLLGQPLEKPNECHGGAPVAVQQEDMLLGGATGDLMHPGVLRDGNIGRVDLVRDAEPREGEDLVL